MRSCPWPPSCRFSWPLVVVLGCAACQALAWVFLVPIYQSPDEPAHLDYALCICERGGLVRPEEVPAVPYDNGWLTCGHPYTRYLLDWADTRTVAFNAVVKVPPEYGSRAYFAALDRDAPPRQTLTAGAPLLASAYPCGYYALLAGWLALVRLATPSLVVLFFAARVFSVLLLVAGLALSYGILRELGMRRPIALWLTAVLGLFPTVSFVASYVQPDNLSFALVSLVFYLALRVRSRPGSVGLLAALGTALAGLLMTKANQWVCIFAAVALLVAARLLATRASWGAWVRAGLLLVLPGVLLVAATCPWTAWGVTYFRTELTKQQGASMLRLVEGVKRAVLDYYAGTTHDSFWGTFGWMDTPLVLGGGTTTALVRAVIQVATWVVLALVLLRLEQVASRLARLAWRGRPRLALSLACASPVQTSYFAFTVFMVWLYVRSDNHFAAQGRNWYPFMLPILLTAVAYAPRALTLPAMRRLAATALLLGLSAYVLAGSCYAVTTLKKRYYPPPLEEPLRAFDVAGTTGEKGEVTFALGQATRVQGIRLHFTLPEPQHAPAFLQLDWGRRATAALPELRRSHFVHVLPGPQPQVLTLWLHETLDEVRVRSLTSPGCLRVERLTVLAGAPAHKECADPGEQPSEGKGAVGPPGLEPGTKRL